MKNDTTFERLMLQDVTKRARKAGADIAKAWVHKSLRTWEFIYGDFYWYGRAENAYHAKAQGWEAWLSTFATRTNLNLAKAKRKNQFQRTVDRLDKAGMVRVRQ